MNDLLIDLGISAVLRILQVPSERTRWRRALLKVFSKIAEAYARDGEFRQAVVKVMPVTEA